MAAKGFTLLEIAVVLMILAIIAGAVALRVEGPLHQASMAEAVDNLTNFDRLTRQTAQQQDRPLWLVLDTGSGQLRQMDERGTPVGTPLKLSGSGDYAIMRLIVQGQGASTPTAAVPYSPQGLSPTFAVQLQGPNRRQKWVLLAGLTGQSIQVDNEPELQKILEALR